jgi:hypothetical protein
LRVSSAQSYGNHNPLMRLSQGNATAGAGTVCSHL